MAPGMKAKLVGHDRGASMLPQDHRELFGVYGLYELRKKQRETKETYAIEYSYSRVYSSTLTYFHWYLYHV